MPFVSKAQERWAFSTHQPWAKKWASITDQKRLPKRKKKRKAKRSSARSTLRRSATKKVRRAKKRGTRSRSARR